MSLTVTESSCFKVTGTTAASQKITDKQVYIKSVYWLAPSDAAHLANLTDKEGGAIITMKGSVDGAASGQTQMWPLGRLFDGVYCDDLDSGTLFIYTR